MKFSFFPVNRFSIIALLFVTFFSCTKEDRVIVKVERPSACFTVQIPDPIYGTILSAGNTTNIDSNFYFRNCSDSGANITYNWNFGDGTTSAETHPRHKYARRGSYPVTLIVTNEKKAFDTSVQIMTAVLGQQHLTSIDKGNLIPLAIEETSNNEFIMLNGASYDGRRYLYRLDSLMSPKNVRSFPLSYQLNSMKATSDGNYVFTGTTQSDTKLNELIKMTGDGTLIWTKVINKVDNYVSALPTPDGGFIVVGSRPAKNNLGIQVDMTVVIKTDNSGNMLWQKLLDQENIGLSANVHLEQDGIVLSGVKPRDPIRYCETCDSVSIVKLNNAGTLLWKNAIELGMPFSLPSGGEILKLSNGNYEVTAKGTRALFFFSTTGKFLDRKLVPYEANTVLNSPDGGLLVAQTGSPNGARSMVQKMEPDGTWSWVTAPSGYEKISTGVSCCSQNVAGPIIRLKKGGTLLTGYRINQLPGNSTIRIIYLLQFNDEGKVM